jgi:hypothetical protein
VLQLRSTIGAGACDYLSVQSGSDRIFAPLRRNGNKWTLPVLLFSDQPVEAALSLAALKLDPKAVYTLIEAFSGAKRTAKGKDLARLELKLPPYAVQVWTVEKTR